MAKADENAKNKQELRRKVLRVLDRDPDGISLSSFWNIYEQTYNRLPECKTFGVRKRSELLTVVCKEECEIITRGKLDFVIKRKASKKENKTVSTSRHQDGKNSSVVTTTVLKDKELSNWPTCAESKSEASRKGAARKQEKLQQKQKEDYKVQQVTKAGDKAAKPGKNMADRYRNPHYGYSNPYQGQSNQYQGQSNPYQGQSNPYQGHGQQYRNQPHYQQQHQPFRQQYISSSELSTIVDSCIDQLVEAKEYVSPERIEALLLQHFNVNSLSEIGCRRLEQIQVVNDLQRMHCKVNAYIQAFVKVRNIATLQELKECLCDFCCPEQEFESLRLGPFAKLPLVYDFFKFPSESTVREITTQDILENVKGYLSENNLWNQKAELEPFMTYMQQKYDVETPYELGIRLRSMPLLIQVLKRSQRDTGKTFRTSITMMNEAMAADVALAFRNFSSSILVKETGLCMIRSSYLQLAPMSVFSEITNKLTFLVNGLLNIQQCNGIVLGRNEAIELSKSQKALASFVDRAKANSLLTKLFHYAICCSVEQMHTDLSQILNLVPAEQSAAERPAQEQKPPPQKVDIVNNTKKYMERCLGHGGMTLANLLRIEEKLLIDFEFPNFANMGHGSFLNFLQNSEEIKKFLEDCGGTSLGGAVSGGAIYQPSLKDLLEFVQITGIQDLAQKSLVEAAMCNHYHVSDVKHLGHGTATHLMALGQKSHASHTHHNLVISESAICAKNKGSCFPPPQTNGLLGSMARENALAALQSCPLLEDLAEWSHWELVFKPQHGALRDFIQKYGGPYTMEITLDGKKGMLQTSILALETRPGTLLKLTGNTSAEDFNKAVKEGNVEDTCGHLVSLVIKNKGISLTPLALLGNHINTALLLMQSSSAPGAPSKPSEEIMIDFVLKCLTKIPLIVCQAVATQVFLEPLSKVLGKQKSKEKLLQHCQSHNETGRLQALGMLLGIQQWSASFQTRSKPGSDCFTPLQVRPKMSRMMEDDIIEIPEEEDDTFMIDDEEIVIESSDSEADFLSDSDDEEEEKNIKQEVTEDKKDQKEESQVPESKDEVVNVDKETGAAVDSEKSIAKIESTELMEDETKKKKVPTATLR